VAVPQPARSPRRRHALVSIALTAALAVLAFAATARLARAPGTNGARLAGDRSAADLELAGAGHASLPPSPAAAAAATPAEPASPALSRTGAGRRLDAFLRTAGRAESFAQANARIVRAWGERSLTQTTLRTHLAQLRAIDLPAALELFHPSRRDTCFVALLHLDERDALIAAGDRPDETVPVQQIDELWTRDAVLSWPEDEALRTDEGRLAEWARPRLAAQGYGGDDLTAAVRRFQAEARLVSDGLLGPRTRIVLFARDPGARPRLSVERGTP
jgi:hypothetical protein